jgi:hypothetical protein
MKWLVDALSLNNYGVLLDMRNIGRAWQYKR